MSLNKGQSLPRSSSAKGHIESYMENVETSPIIETLEILVRQVRCDLKHLRDVIAKNKLEMLQENGTIILDTIIKIYSVVRPYTSPFGTCPSAPLRSALSLLCQSLARVIEVCDIVMLKNDTKEVLSQQNVENVTKQLQQAVKEVASTLVTKLINEAHEDSCRCDDDPNLKLNKKHAKKHFRNERSKTAPAHETEQKIIPQRKLSDTSMSGNKKVVRNSSFKDTLMERFAIYLPKDHSSSIRIRDHREEGNSAVNPALDLESLIRQVRYALRHLCDVIIKHTLQMLPENCSIVLNTITKIHTVIKPYSSLSDIWKNKESRLCVAITELSKLCEKVMAQNGSAGSSQNLKLESITQEVQLAVEDLASMAFKVMADRTTEEFQNQMKNGPPQLNAAVKVMEDLKKSSNEITTQNTDCTECIIDIIENASRHKMTSKNKWNVKEFNSQESEQNSEEAKDQPDRNSTNSSYSTTSSQPLTESDIPSANSNQSIDSFDMFDNKRLSSDSSSTGKSKSVNRLSNDCCSSSHEDDNYSTAINLKNDTNYGEASNSTASNSDKISFDEVDNRLIHLEETSQETHASTQDDQFIIYREHDCAAAKSSPSPRAQTLMDFSFKPLPFKKKLTSYPVFQNSTYSVMTYMDMFGKSTDSSKSSSDTVRHSEPVFDKLHPKHIQMNMEYTQPIEEEINKSNQNRKGSITKEESVISDFKTRKNDVSPLEKTVARNECKQIITTNSNCKETSEEETLCQSRGGVNSSIQINVDKISISSGKVAESDSQHDTKSVSSKDVVDNSSSFEQSMKATNNMNYCKNDVQSNNKQDHHCNKMPNQDKLTSVKVEVSSLKKLNKSPLTIVINNEMPKNIKDASLVYSGCESQNKNMSTPRRSKIPPPPPRRWCHLTTSQNNLDQSKSSNVPVNLNRSPIPMTKVEDCETSKSIGKKPQNSDVTSAMDICTKTVDGNLENNSSNSDRDYHSKHKIEKQFNFCQNSECNEMDLNIQKRGDSNSEKDRHSNHKMEKQANFCSEHDNMIIKCNDNLESHSPNSDKDCNSKHKMEKQANFCQSTERSETDSMQVQKETVPEPDLIMEMDVSSWLEFKNVAEDGPNIKGGHPDALIIHAIESPKGSLHQEAFLVTYSTFITPIALIEKIIRRYLLHVMQGRITKSQELLAVLVLLLKDLPLAELDSELLQLVTKFIYGLICFEDLLMANTLRSTLIEKYKRKQFEQEQAMTCSNIQWNFLTPGRKETILDHNSESYAEQITLLDAELFAKLPESEALYWARNQCQAKCPNLALFTEHFNKLSFWVTSRILEQSEAREREKYTVKFIRIMKHLRKINNFNSMVAILLALNSTVISRLNKHNNIMDGLEEYMALIDDSYNFKACRQALNEAQPPCIPHIALTLKDLTALHNGSPNLLSDGKINFSKRWQQYIILDNIRRFRKVPYPLKKQDQILAIFSNFDKIHHEDTMWEMSYFIKPRG